MPNETVTVTISGVNGPLTRTLVIPVATNTGQGTGTVNWIGNNPGLDSISASGTINGQSYTSNTAQSRWGFNDIAAAIPSATGQGSVANAAWTFVVIGVFPDGTHTGPSQPVTTSFTGFYLQWTPLAGVSYYNIYCTQSVQGSASGNVATVGLLHGNGSQSSTIGGGGPNFPPSITQLWMAVGTAFTYAGDGSAPPSSNTTLQVPSLAAPSGHLTITPSGSAVVVGGVNSLTVTISGIAYSSIPYIPLYQGTTGSLPLYNDSVNNVFNYPTYNGQPVNKSTAITQAWALSGDNTYWQGRLGLSYDGTNINLVYNGSAPAANIDITNFTVAADDIAWYNSVAGTYDAFTTQGNAGGISQTVLVEWLVKPTIASVSPTTTTGNGNAQTFTVTLASPVSPRQLGTAYGTGNSLTASFSGSGMAVTGYTANYNSNGWLTGWNVTATTPLTSTNVTATLSASITGNLTYLNGSTFTTGPVTYISGVIATITFTGAGFVAPSEYSFAVSQQGGSARVIQIASTSAASTSSVSLTLPSPVSAGNTLIAVLGTTFSGSANATISNSFGDGFSNVSNFINKFDRSFWVSYASISKTGTCSVSATTASSQTLYWVVMEVSGLTSLDAAAATNFSSLPSVSLANAPDKLFSILYTKYIATLTSANFTQNAQYAFLQYGGNDQGYISVASSDATSAGTYSCSWTRNGNDGFASIFGMKELAANAFNSPIPVTLTAQVFQQQYNTPVTLEFIMQSGSTKTNLVAGTQTARVAATVNGQAGYLTTFTGTFTASTLPGSPGAYLGFTATDSTSGLSSTYLTSGTYYYI